MIVEDSPTVRSLLGHIIASDGRLELAAAFESAEEAIEAIPRIAPDVISMDVRLPGIDGLEATRRIMAEHPTPIVVIADSIYDETLSIAMTALKAGALTVVEKPAGPGSSSYQAIAATIATQLFIMSQVPVIRRRTFGERNRTGGAAESDVGPAPPRAGANYVGMAASTGGPPALAAVLGALPASFPAPILLVQHIGAPFVEGFAAWLAGQTALKVEMAKEFEIPSPGCVYVAPGERHLAIGPGGRIRLTTDPPQLSQRPAANVLFRSLAAEAGPRAVGVLLTGMGEDGAQGLLAMRKAGAFTVAEDPQTAVVDGMPGAARKLGAVSQSLPLGAIGRRLVELTARAAHE